MFKCSEARGVKGSSALRQARRAAFLSLALCSPALAQNEPPPGVAPQPTIATSLPANGDPFGTRHSLAERGVTFGFIHTTELLSNVKGGLARKTIFDGKLEAMVGIDFGRLAGWDGLSFYANGFQLHGNRGPNRMLVGGLNTVSNIEALPTTRLSEVWLERQLFDGKASIRAGQLVVDTEFLVSQYFNFFISSDWPTNPKTGIPSSGPAYPLSTPGVRLKIDPTPQATALLAVFNGDPAGQCGLEAEQCNRHGLNFRVKDPPYLIGELQYRYNQDPAATGLAGGVRTRRVASLRSLRAPAFCQRRLFARQSARQRHSAPPARQRRRLCGVGPAALPAARRRRQFGRAGFQPCGLQPSGPQRRRFLPRWRHHFRRDNSVAPGGRLRRVVPLRAHLKARART